LIGNVLEYQDYLSASEIENLENIRNSELFDLLKDNPVVEYTKFRESDAFKVNFTNSLIDVVSAIKKIKQQHIITPSI